MYDRTCHRHPGYPVRYIRLVAMYRVHSVQESVQLTCENCHRELLAERAQVPAGNKRVLRKAA